MRISRRKLLAGAAGAGGAYLASRICGMFAANPSALAARVHEAATACGYDACGVIRAAEMRGYGEAIADRIARFPESRRMYAPLARYAEPEKEHPWAKSIVVCARWHGGYFIPGHLEGLIGKSFLVDTRIDARSRAYQDGLRFEAALADLGLRAETKKDFGITGMRWAAMKAGIGVIRQNNFLYGPKGSWYSLEAYLVDQEMELKHIPAIAPCPKHCGLCRRACPTGALAEAYQTNGTACMSYLMGFADIEPGKRHYDKTGAWIFGCDACQNACPKNRGAWKAVEEYPGLEELGRRLSYERILTMDYAEMRATLPPKFWYIKEDKVWKWKCNVLNAMRNTYVERYLPYIADARRDEHENVRAMAEWVFRSVSG